MAALLSCNLPFQAAGWNFIDKDSATRKIEIPQNALLTDYLNSNIINTHYIIRHVHDLSRYANGLTVGNNCILEFKRGGGLRNGKLKCSSIAIKGRKTKFVDIYIEVIDATRVRMENVSAFYTFANDDFVRISNSENIFIKGVRVVFDEGNRQRPDGRYIEAEGFDLIGCGNISLINCSIINSKSQYADSEHGSLICKECHNVSVDGCFSSGGHNEVFNFISCEDVVIKNTIVRGGSGSAISTAGGENFIIDNCKSYNVGSSAFSFNSRKMTITNCLAKDWKIFNGITLGHSEDNLRVGDVVVDNCKMILSDNVNSHRKCALGGVIEGKVIVKNCDFKTSRICSFDGLPNSEKVSLSLDNNKIKLFKGDTTANYFRASNIFYLNVSGNTFDGNADISLLGYSSGDLRAGVRKLNISNNTFKRGAEIKNELELKSIENVVFEGNVKKGKVYKLKQ